MFDPETAKQTAVLHQQVIVSMWQTAVMALQLVLVVGTLFYAARQIRMARDEVTRDSTYECEMLYFEVMKSVLADDELQPFFATGNPKTMIPYMARDPKERRLWLLGELHIFQFAFVYREWLFGRVPDSYWNIWNRFLHRLVKTSKLFRDVCESSLKYFGGATPPHGQLAFDQHVASVFAHYGFDFAPQDFDDFVVFMTRKQAPPRRLHERIIDAFLGRRSRHGDSGTLTRERPLR